MTNFEFDDIIRRKLENAKYGNAEKAFAKVKGKLLARRYSFYLRNYTPYLAVLFLGIGIGYLINDYNRENKKIEGYINQTTLYVSQNDKTRENQPEILKNKINSNQNDYNSVSVLAHNSNLSDKTFVKQKEAYVLKSGRSHYDFHAGTIKQNMNDHMIVHENAGEPVESIFLPNANPSSEIPSTIDNRISNQVLQETIQNNQDKKSEVSVRNNDSSLVGLNPMVNYFKEKKNNFYFHIYGGYSFGWKDNGVLIANAINPELGLIYERNLPENLLFRTGINLTMLRELNNCVNTFTVVESDVRYRQTNWEFYTPIIYYLRVPVALGIRDKSLKNAFHVGAFINFLMNSKNEIRKITHQAGEIYKEETFTDFGYAMDGFNRFNFEFSMGYRRGIKKNLRIGIDINYHITNVVKNYSYFNRQYLKSSKAPSVYAGIEYKF
ncbi:MAG: hypothetical protein N3F09_10435 [Bacteroidia bacterium]|nr:hypothetical protein [Bacteroidia bacterium]